MTGTIDTTQASRTLLILTCIFAPWFYLRWGGFTFSVGNSLSLVDLFLFLGVALLAWRLTQDIRLETVLHGTQRWLLAIGVIFVFFGALSGVTRDWVNTNYAMSWPALLSGLSQYAFVLVVLPLITGVLLGGANARLVIRLLGIGYLLPMIANLLLLRPDVLPEVSFMFTAVGRAIGSYGNANAFAGVIMLMLPYYLYLAYVETGRWGWVGIVGAGLSMTCLLLTASFSGFLIAAGCIGANLLLILVWKGHPARREPKVWASRTALVCIVFVLFSAIAALYSPTVQTALAKRLAMAAVPVSTELTDAEMAEGSLPSPIGNVGSASQRLDMIGTAFELIAERQGGLFYGHGLRQTTVMDEFAFGGTHLDVHLVYLLLWIEGGAVMALLFLAYLGVLFVGCFRYLRSRPGLAIATATSVLAFVLLGMVMPHLYLRYFWVPMMPAMALAGGLFAPRSEPGDAR